MPTSKAVYSLIGSSSKWLRYQKNSSHQTFSSLAHQDHLLFRHFPVFHTSSQRPFSAVSPWLLDLSGLLHSQLPPLGVRLPSPMGSFVSVFEQPHGSPFVPADPLICQVLIFSFHVPRLFLSLPWVESPHWIPKEGSCLYATSYYPLINCKLSLPDIDSFLWFFFEKLFLLRTILAL